MLKHLAVAVVTAVALSVAASAHSLVKFDFEQKFFVEFGVEVKDHSLIRVDGVYHLFYLRGNPARNIGHATSSDLIHWEIQPPLLYVVPGEWDGLAMWAPQVLRTPDGMFLMYYTGVNSYGSQQTGMAFSSDLYSWTKIPWPVYHPSPSWAGWGETLWCHGRDPFVFEHEGMFYHLLTAKTPYNRGAIACGVASGYFDWQDRGPLYVHNTWHVLESVQCIHRNSLWYLFYTEETVNGTSYMVSDSLFTGWDPATAVLIDYGHAPEINEFDANKYVISRHSIHRYYDGTGQFVIRADTLRWAGESPYVYRPWPLGGQWTNVWGNAFLFQPTFLNNPRARGVDIDVNFEGLCWLSSYERYQGPLGVGASGAYQGDSPMGLMRSKPFTIEGNSMRLRVGGGNYPNECYVALVETGTSAVLFKETGKNTDAMDERVWDLRPHKGKTCYIEIADNSSAAFGHISCDGIVESFDIVAPDSSGTGTGSRKSRKETLLVPDSGTPPSPRLMRNAPNPFNPSTTIPYFLPRDADVTLDVFDLSGARVRRLREGRDPAGTHFAAWDGRNDSGDPVPSGVYFSRLQVDGAPVATEKMVLLK
jgi:hypothetical protein